MVSAQDDGGCDLAPGDCIVEFQRDLNSPYFVSVEYPCLGADDQIVLVCLDNPPDVVIILRADLVTATFG